MRLFRWSAMGLIGVVGGIILGDMTVGPRLGGSAVEPASYSHLSANPDGLAPHDNGAVPCPGCADSYGVAMRLRAHRDDRMNDEFRELGAVNTDPPMLADAGDDYRYGGRFPDPVPVAAATTEDPHTIKPAGDSSPANIITPVPAEY